MTKEQLKEQNKIKQDFLKRAKKERIEVFRNNIKSAKPLNNFCGRIKTSHPSEIEDLLCGR